MKIVSLASGSKGNAYLVVGTDTTVLVDCGLNYKTLTARMAACGVSLFSAVLLTHSHRDHTEGLKVLVKKHPDIVVYANAMTAETVAHDLDLNESTFACFENGQNFEVGCFKIHPFSIPHDTSDPVGYLIREQPTTNHQPPTIYFHGTDIGSPLDSVGTMLAQADLATLESNHDPVMLHGSGRPPSTIQRIYGPRGHLSNDQAAELVARFARPRLKKLALAHLSRDCNTPQFAERIMRETLVKMGRTDIELKVLSQDDVIEL